MEDIKANTSLINTYALLLYSYLIIMSWQPQPAKSRNQGPEAIITAKLSGSKYMLEQLTQVCGAGRRRERGARDAAEISSKL